MILSKWHSTNGSFGGKIGAGGGRRGGGGVGGGAGNPGISFIWDKRALCGQLSESVSKSVE